jgi:hypothetical protein
MIHLIHCKNLCKCHNVPPPSTTIKRKKAQKNKVRTTTKPKKKKKRRRRRIVFQTLVILPSILRVSVKVGFGCMYVTKI